MIEVARQILNLPIADIQIGARVGFFHAAHAEALAASMAEVGQIDPIHVAESAAGAAQPWTLVAGRHRIAAAELCGMASIAALIVADATESPTLLRWLELSENLDHRSPRPIERAIFIEALASVAEAAQHPDHIGERSQDRAARLRWDASDTVSLASDWRSRLACSQGCSVRTIERFRAIHRTIVEPFPDLAEALNASPLCESFSVVRRIVSIANESSRRRAIETILARPELETLDAVMFHAGLSTSKGARSPERERAQTDFERGWQRMNLTERRVTATWLAKLVPPGIARAMVDEFQRRNIL